MKVVAFNCSPREKGNTYTMIRTVLDELESEGIKTEIVQVGGTNIHGCRACGGCARHKNMKCVFDDDGVNGYFEKMKEADGIIIGTPTYFSDMTPEAKALIDRCGYIAGANGNPLKRKVGAAVVAVRRAGGVHAFDSINHLFTIREMIIVGSSYWNVGVSRDIGDFAKDEEGIRTMKTLGSNMSWVLKKLE